MFRDLDKGFHFKWLRFLQLFFLSSVIWVHSGIQTSTLQTGDCLFTFWEARLENDVENFDQCCKQKVKFIVI